MSDAAVLETSKESRLLRWIANAIGPLALLVFGIALYRFAVKESLFTFSAWGSLDFLVAFSMYKAGSKREARLPLAYGITAFFVVGMILRNATWELGVTEGLCALGAFLSILGWRKGGPVVSVVMLSVTMFVAGVPLLIESIHEPQTWNWWLWAGSIASGCIYIYLSWPLRRSNIADWMFGVTSVIYGVLILLIIFR